MKKLLVILALVAFCFVSADAQKQIGGDKILEVNFTPLGGTPISMNGIKIRIFPSETFAVRANVFIGTTTNKDTLFQANTQPAGAAKDDQVNPVLLEIDKTFDFTLQPGVEIHMDGTDRLSPYIGAVIDFGIGTESTETEQWGPGDLDDAQDFDNWVQWSSTVSTGYTRFGIFAVAGADVYIFDNVYLGAELGLGFTTTSYRDIEHTSSNAVAWSIAYDGSEDADPLPPRERGSMNAFGPVTNGAIRLGWIFAQ